MATGWLDPNKYEHIDNTSATGPGTMYEGYAWKFVNHSTEGPPGSIAGTIGLFRAQPASCPHFMIDPMGTGRRVQFIPWTWSACALRGGAGGYQTNRGRAVQMEICGYARDSASWPDDALWTIADVIADVIKDGCPINPTNAPDDSGLSGTLATMSAPQRMSWPTWQLFDGITAHVRAPNNDHWDCGTLNSRRISALVQEILGGNARVVVPSEPGVLPAPPPSTQVGYLTMGMIGGQITHLQELLTGLGYSPGSLDGVFGFRTRNAVVAFQRDAGIEDDGVVGPVTAAKLSERYAAVSDKPPLPVPADPATGAPAWPGRFLVLTTPMMEGGDISTWQARMAERGWAITVDGFYGTESLSVCKTFQAEKGLTCDGIVGQQTWSAAWSAPVS